MRQFLITSFLICILIGITIQDQSLYSSRFMNDHEIKFVLKVDEDFSSRNIASVDSNASQSPKISLSAQEKEMILKGDWSVRKILFAPDSALKSSLPVEQIIHKMVKFYLKKSDLTDDSSRLEDLIDLKILKTSIFLYDLNFLEMKKIESQLAWQLILENPKLGLTVHLEMKTNSPAPEKPSTSPVASNSPSIQEELASESSSEYVLESLISGDNPQQAIKGEQARGTLKMHGQLIQSLSISYSNSKGEEQEIEVRDENIQNNYFKYMLDDQPLSGTINRSGQGEYIVSLINGKLIGTKMRFMKAEILEAKEEEQNEERPHNDPIVVNPANVNLQTGQVVKGPEMANENQNQNEYADEYADENEADEADHSQKGKQEKTPVVVNQSEALQARYNQAKEMANDENNVEVQDYITDKQDKTGGGFHF